MVFSYYSLRRSLISTPSAIVGLVNQRSVMVLLDALLYIGAFLRSFLTS